MTSTRTLMSVYAALLALLALTVGASTVLTGTASLAVGLLIALAKAGLIFWIFMGLKDESGLIRLAAFGAAAWLLILLSLSGADYLTRRNYAHADIGEGYDTVE